MGYLSIIQIEESVFNPDHIVIYEHLPIPLLNVHMPGDITNLNRYLYLC